VHRPSIWGCFSFLATVKSSNSARARRHGRPCNFHHPYWNFARGTEDVTLYFDNIWTGCETGRTDATGRAVIRLHVLRNRKWATPQRCSYHAKKQIFALQSNGRAPEDTSSGRNPKGFPLDRRASGICLYPHCITLFHWKRTKDIKFISITRQMLHINRKAWEKNTYYKDNWKNSFSGILCWL
jgi:hypothetical protein